MRTRVLAVTALSTVLLGASACAEAGSPAAYTRAATEACLASLPGSVVGMPPASPPSSRALFIDALARDDLSAWEPPRRAHRQLGVWYAGRTYEGVILSFFKTFADARASVKSALLYGRKVLRNVVASWDQKPVPTPSVRSSVFGCLRSHGPAGGLPKKPVPRASLATFAGYWGGHTRGLSIGVNGRAKEEADDGCCTRAYRLAFQIVSVSGSLTRATAFYRVLSYERFESDSRLRIGEVGKLVLRDGIVTNTLTDDYFCSDPAWGATGACGA